MQTICLNLHDPVVKYLVQTYGKEQTYRMWITNNFSFPAHILKPIETQAQASAYRLGEEIRNILPDFIEYRDIFELNKLHDLDLFGAFYKNVVYLNRFAADRQAYHEAFHALFRTVFTADTKQTVLDVGYKLLAKNNASIPSIIQQAREDLPAIYGELTDQEIYERLAEEEVADLFQTYMNQRVSNTVANTLSSVERLIHKVGNKTLAKVLQKVFDAILRAISRISNNIRLSMLFSQIRRGDYKYAKPVGASEQYKEVAPISLIIGTRAKTKVTNGQEELVTTSDGRVDTEDMLMKSGDTQRLVNDIFNQLSLLEDSNDDLQKYLATKPAGERFDILFDAVLDGYVTAANNQLKELFRVDKDLARQIRETGNTSGVKNRSLQYLFEIRNALTDSKEVDEDASLARAAKNKAALKEAVLLKKAYYQNIDELTDDIQDTDLDDKGDAQVDFDKRPENIDPWSTLPTTIRKLIATTYYVDEDAEFEVPVVINTGTDQITVPTALIHSVDEAKVYGTILRGCVNQNSWVTLLKKLESIAKIHEIRENGVSRKYGNVEVYTFWDQFKKRVGLDASMLDQGQIVVAKGKTALMTQFLQGVNKFQKDPMFMEIDPGAGKVLVYEANRSGVDRTQVNQWRQQFENKLTNQSILDTFQEDFKKVFEIVHNGFATTTKAFAPDKSNHLHHLYEDESPYVGQQGLNELDTATKTVYQHLHNVGLSVSYNYIRHSLIRGKFNQYVENKENRQQYSVEQAKGVAVDYETWLKDQLVTAQKFDSSLLSELEGILIPYDQLLVGGEHIKEIYNLILQNKSLFSDVRDEDGQLVEGEGNVGAVSRLIKLAKGNAHFDEGVFDTVYENADGEKVFNIQSATYHLQFFNSLSDTEFLAKLQNGERPFNQLLDDDSTEATILNQIDSNFLQQNPLLSQEIGGNLATNFLELARRGVLKVMSLDGFRQVEFREKSNKAKGAQFTDRKDGVTFAGMSGKDYLNTLMNLYTDGATTLDVNGKQIVSTMLPIGILEAKRTNDLIRLPVVTGLVQEGKITDKALTLIGKFIELEYTRIQQVQQAIDNKSSAEYKVYSKLKNYLKRGVQLSDAVAELLPDSVKKEVESQAKQDVTFSLETIIEDKSIKEHLHSQLELLNEKLINKLREGNILKKGDARNFLSGLFEGKALKDKGKVTPHQLGFDTNLTGNIKQVILNNYIVTNSLAMMLHGDSALLYKNDGADTTKRQGSGLAAGPGMANDPIQEVGSGATDSLSTFKVSISDEPNYTSDIDREHVGDVADAQMYTTAEGMRKFLKALGRFSPVHEKVLHNLEIGRPVNPEDIFGRGGLLDRGQMLNSMKLVYTDGRVYLKMSVIGMYREFTSMLTDEAHEQIQTLEKGQQQYETNSSTWTSLDKAIESVYANEQNWKAKPGYETLHEKRVAMEANNITLQGPESACKMLTYNKMPLNAEKDMGNYTMTLQGKFLKLQMENPSNKLKIKDPTQMIQIIDNEQNEALEVVLPDGTTTTVGAIRNQYIQALKGRTIAGLMNARNELFSIEDLQDELQTSFQMGKITPKLDDFYKRAVETLKSSGASKQTIDFFTIDEENPYRFNQNFPTINSKFTQLYLASLSGAFSHKVAGHQIALVSSHGVSVLRRVRKVNGRIQVEVIKQSDPAYRKYAADVSIQDVRKLSMNEAYKVYQDTLQEGDDLVYLDILRHNVPEYDSQGRYLGVYSEAMLPAQEADTVGGLTEEQAKMFGVRIPSQDKHSGINLRIVDSLPVTWGSSGVFSQEIVRLSGADYDIDKLYIHRKDGYYKGGKFVKWGSATTIEDKWKEFVTYTFKYNRQLSRTAEEVLGRAKFLLDEDTGAPEIDAINKAANQSAIEKVFTKLGLPPTMDAYQQKLTSLGISSLVIPALNNEELDAKMALWGNKETLGITKALQLAQRILSPEGYQAFERLLDTYPMLSTELLPVVENGVFMESPYLTAGLNYELESKPAVLTQLRKEVADLGIIHQPAEDTKLKFVDKFTDPVGSKPFEVNSKSIFGGERQAASHHLLKQVSDKESNTVGKDGIGLAVVLNQISTLLAKTGTNLVKTPKYPGKFSIIIRNVKHDFKKFSYRTGLRNERVFDLISAFISAATDEAKNKVLAKYKLSPEAMPVAIAMVALGVEIEVAIAFVNQPVIQEFSRLKQQQAANRFLSGREDEFKSEEELYVEALSKFNNDKKVNVKFSFENLAVTLREQYRIANQLPSEEILSQDEINALQHLVLDKFQYLSKISADMYKAARFIRATKGLGTDLNYFEQFEEAWYDFNIKGEGELSTTFAMGEALSSQSGEAAWTNSLGVKQIHELNRKVFLNRTALFGGLRHAVARHLKTKLNKDQENNLTKHLVTYMIFQRWKDKYGPSFAQDFDIHVEDLHKLIFDPNEAIDQVVSRIKRNPKYKENQFVQRLIVDKPNHAGNRGAYTVSLQVPSRLDVNAQEGLLQAVEELFREPDTVKDMIHLLLHWAVKDGLNYKSKSLSNYFAVDLVTTFSKALDEVMLIANELEDDPALFRDEKDLKDKLGVTFLSQYINKAINLLATDINNVKIVQLVGKLGNKKDYHWDAVLQRRVPTGSKLFTEDLTIEEYIDDEDLSTLMYVSFGKSKWQDAEEKLVTTNFSTKELDLLRKHPATADILNPISIMQEIEALPLAVTDKEGAQETAEKIKNQLIDLGFTLDRLEATINNEEKKINVIVLKRYVKTTDKEGQTLYRLHSYRDINNNVIIVDNEEVYSPIMYGREAVYVKDTFRGTQGTTQMTAEPDQYPEATITKSQSSLVKQWTSLVRQEEAFADNGVELSEAAKQQKKELAETIAKAGHKVDPETFKALKEGRMKSIIASGAGKFQAFKAHGNFALVDKYGNKMQASITSMESIFPDVIAIFTSKLAATGSQEVAASEANKVIRDKYELTQAKATEFVTGAREIATKPANSAERNEAWNKYRYLQYTHQKISLALSTTTPAVETPVTQPAPEPTKQQPSPFMGLAHSEEQEPEVKAVKQPIESPYSKYFEDDMINLTPRNLYEITKDLKKYFKAVSRLNPTTSELRPTDPLQVELNSYMSEMKKLILQEDYLNAGINAIKYQIAQAAIDYAIDSENDINIPWEKFVMLPETIAEVNKSRLSEYFNFNTNPSSNTPLDDC